VAATDEVAVSVVVPLLRDREVEVDGLAAWTRQTLPTGAVEVVAVSPEVPRPDAAVRRLLRRSDRLLVVPGMDESGLWDAGARTARGRVLVLTEGHTVPQPGCLAAAVAALEGGLDVACFESRAPELTAAAWLEDAVFQDWFERRVDDGDPRAVSLRGVALPAEMYARAGGLHAQVHECFAERLLAARLDNAGARIGRASGAVVDHMPNTRFRSVRADSLNFYREEVGARLAGPAGEIDADAHLDGAPEWDRRARFDPALNRAALPGLLRLAPHPGPAGRAARRAVLGTTVRAVAGPQPAAWTAALRSRLATAVLAVTWPFGRRPDPSSVWGGLARASVLRVLAERSRSGERTRQPLVPAVGEVVAVDRLADHAVGLHPAERLSGATLRWTEPLVVLDLRVPATATTLTLRLLHLRSLDDGQVIAAWGPRQLPSSEVRVRPSSVTVSVRPGTQGPLTIAVPRLPAPGDPRRLGLALVDLVAA
jgi:hypothetical protein